MVVLTMIKVVHNFSLYIFRAQGELGGNGSDVDSEEEEEGADYTVYECPGLAPVRILYYHSLQLGSKFSKVSEYPND